MTDLGDPNKSGPHLSDAGREGFDRLLELAGKAKGEASARDIYMWGNRLGDAPLTAEQEYVDACNPDTIIGLIERVKEAEESSEVDGAAAKALIKGQEHLRRVIDKLEARLRAAEERAEHWQRECDRQRADNQYLRDVAEAARRLNEIVIPLSEESVEFEPSLDLTNALRSYDEVVKE